jgi:hypothetical protein
MTLSLFRGDQFGQSNLHGTVWLSSHPVINNLLGRTCHTHPGQRTCHMAYSLCLLSATYMPSLAYSMYLPLATYMTLAMYTPSLVCLHAFFGVLTVLDLGIFVLLILALRGTAAVTSCKQQHKFLIVAWECVRSSLAFVCCCHCSSQYDNKE